MSGSSLDGVDVCYCTFAKNEKWGFEILAATTYPLGIWSEKLANARHVEATTLLQFNADFGIFLGELCQKFLLEVNLPKPDLIASHGHTIFHFPEKGFTYQVGCGAKIAACTKTLTVYNLRQADVALGGNGAPIVPIGDKHLFGEYAFCLNLGGIANITYQHKSSVLAYDICAANQVLNYFALKCGFEYDDGGKLARQGTVNQNMLTALNNLDFYKIDGPKSLDNGFSKVVIDLMNTFKDTPKIALRTYTEHLAITIGNEIKKYDTPNSKMLITGGGALNTFLIEKIKENSIAEVVVPHKTIIDFKEALVMAFIGVLRIRNEVNCLASVTGASQDSVGGEVCFV